MTDFDLNIHGNIFLFLLIFAALIGLSIYVYRWTIPPVPRWLRRILAILRIASLAIILFILFEPILNISWNRTEKPIVAVLLDNSASMTLKDNGEVRSDNAKAIVVSDLFQKSSKDNSFDFFQFSHTLAPLSTDKLDSTSFNNDGTDLTRSLKILQERNIDRYLRGVVLITDGINNLGDNPVRFIEEFDTPIFPIAVGNSVEQKDVVLTKIAANQVTYVNNKVPVEVSLQVFGYQNQKIEVYLQQGADVLDSKIIDIENNIFETRVQLNFTPKQPGFIKYSVRIPVLENELTALNNQKNFYTKVLQSKMKILFIAGGPSADLKFLKKNLESDPNVETSFWVVKKNQEFYQGSFSAALPKLTEYDCIILQDFPTRTIPLEVINSIKRTIETKQTPLLFIAGNGVHYPSLSALTNYLPIAPPLTELNEIQVIARLTSQGIVHPATRLSDDEIENQQLWRNMPPIYLSLHRVNMQPGSEILLETDPEQTLLRNMKEPLPLVIAQKLGQHKSIAILGYGIWRWDLLMWGIGRTNEVLKQFLSNSIRWLITKEDSKPVRIYPDQEIYRNGQQITFTGEVYYEDFRPMDGAEVKLTVTGKQKSYEILLSGLGDGKYEGALQALEGGDYSFDGIAAFNNRVIGSDKGQFSVEDFNLEFLQTRMNAILLQQVALKTGGKFFTEKNYSNLDSVLNFPSRKILESREFELWNRIILLLAIIIFLSIEWFIRKRSGML
jgi:hypothetical protein